MSCNYVLPGEEINDLLRNGLRIIQSSKLPKFNTDSILLANFPKLKNRWSVCDLCTGTGIIPLLLTTRAKELKITAVELNHQMIDMAQRSIELNRLQEQIKLRHEDIRANGLTMGSFDLVTVNPPYFPLHKGPMSGDIARAQARNELELTLSEVVSAGFGLLKDKGLLAMVYHTSGIGSLLTLLNNHNFAVTRLRFIHHKLNTKASSCLIEAQKRAKHQTIVEPPLVIYQESGEFTPELHGVYYQGKSLESRAY